MSTPQVFWQTLLAALSGLDDVLVGTTALLDAVYMDVSPQQAALYQTVNVAIPAPINTFIGQVTNSTTNKPVFNQYTLTNVPISLDQHPQWGLEIPTFDQYTSPVSIKDKLLKPGLAAVAMYANGVIANLINSTNLNVNPVVSTTGSAVTPDQFVAGGVTQLMNQNVDVRNPELMTFVQHPNVWGKQMRNDAWAQESQVGILQAQAARRDANLKVAYGCKQDVDSQMVATGTAGSRTFRSVYMSKYAIAAAFRPIAPLHPTIDTTYVVWKGVPLRVSFGPSIKDDCNYLNIDCGMGAKVVRPEQAVLFSTAE